jgi:hypothetical protein
LHPIQQWDPRKGAEDVAKVPAPLLTPAAATAVSELLATTMFSVTCSLLQMLLPPGAEKRDKKAKKHKHKHKKVWKLQLFMPRLPSGSERHDRRY